MPSKFITNQDKLLSRVMGNIIPESKSIYALVGYFYFSGFFELYDKLKNKQVKILIGLDVEPELNNKLKEFYLLQEQGQRKSYQQAKNEYFKSLSDLINETDFCDTKEKQKAFKLFLKKIKNNTLELRRTKEPNHAKLYIFESEDKSSRGGELPGTVITGSSNLTLSGLRNRFEINVISHEAQDYKVSKKIFDNLWEEAYPLVSQKNIDEFIDKVVDKIWIDKLPRPYLVYLRVINELFNIPQKDLTCPSEISQDYFDLEYQKDAVKKTMDILDKHSGAIIADVVGLGKSIVASTTAYNLNKQTIIICPPHLRDQWLDYKRTFNLKAEVYSSGSIHKALRHYKNITAEKLIIVDEAHKYRNELTQDYKNLHRLCSGNKVLLLSATPFNNKPQDIFSMIKLFQIPAKSTIRTVDNLSNKFRELIAEYKKIKKIQKGSSRKQAVKQIADQIRALLNPLVIRRSRIDLDKIPRYKADLKKQGIAFSKVNPPKLLEYDLGELKNKYLHTLEQIIGKKKNVSGFIGARYKPTAYIKPESREKYGKEIEQMYGDKNLFTQSQSNIAEFMKRLLVRRFESSIYSFYSTLDSMILSMETVKNWYDKIGKVPVYKKGDLPDPEEMFDTADDDGNLQLKSWIKSLKNCG
jgi:superfamily II DNA or RNA helicase